MFVTSGFEIIQNNCAKSNYFVPTKWNVRHTVLRIHGEQCGIYCRRRVSFSWLAGLAGQTIPESLQLKHYLHAESCNIAQHKLFILDMVVFSTCLWITNLSFCFCLQKQILLDTGFIYVCGTRDASSREVNNRSAELGSQKGIVFLSGTDINKLIWRKGYIPLGLLRIVNHTWAM